MTINQRIKFLVDTYSKGNSSAFARSIDVSPTVIASYLPGGRESKPSYDVLEKILEVYPAIRIQWLMKGEGDMTEAKAGSSQHNQVVGNIGNLAGRNIHQTQTGSSDCEQQLQAALIRISDLEARLKDKDELIALLRSK